MRKIIFSTVILMALVLVGYFFASPYHTLYQIKTAADNHDATAIADKVDFPQVKSSIKSQLKANMMDKLAGQLPDDDMQMLGAMFATAMVDGMVDVMVSPSAIELMIDGKSIGEAMQTKLSGTIPNAAPNHDNKAGADGSANKTTSPSINSDDWAIDTSYRGINHFDVDIMRTDQTDAQHDNAVTLKMARQGLFQWKIVDVTLPAGMMNQ